ncbi:MAG: hypothetical protein KDB07_03965 [Planctomycetes bacterium]|nr:hypothetical protein [Planctomycetota bacterium]
MDDLTPKTPAELGLDADIVDEASDILNPFEKLVPVKVLDKLVYLPENNSMWRGLQFWGLVKGEVSIDFSLYCIAGTCKNCKALVKRPQDADRDAMLLCQTQAEAGTEIRKLPSGFRLKTRSW